MIPATRYVWNLCIASKAINIKGAVVECGVWRGGMSAGMADVLGPDRNYFLFDSFQGLPPTKPIDGPAAHRFEVTGSKETNNATASEDEADSAMRMSCARNYRLVKGWFEDSIPGFETGPIAVLRLDGDWYDSTMLPLKHLYPKLVENGIVIIDDYMEFDGCSRAIHDFIQTVPEPLRLLQYANSVHYFVKPPALAVATS